MHPLVLQIRLVARRAWALVFYRGLAWCVCAIVVAVFFAGWLDYWFRFSESGLRWLVSGALAAFVLWSLLRFVWPALWFRRSDTFFAQIIEHRFPSLRDRLSSAVAFLRDAGNDPRNGSPSLRENVVTEATLAIQGINVFDCLDSRGTKQALIASLVTLSVVIGICAVDVKSSLLAAQRLVRPWSSETWPRRNWLVFTKRPERLAVGGEFYAELKDQRGWLPSEVTILYWFDGDSDAEIRSHRMEFVGGKMTHRLPSVTRSFRYRAVGGDDQNMEWTRLQVVEPPRIVDSQMVLRPPAYTGLADETSTRSLRGFAGTSVIFSGRTSKPVSSATLLFVAGKNVRRHPAAIGADGMTYQLPARNGQAWVLSESGVYGWLLVDRDGVSQRAEPNSPVDVLQDQPPTVTLLNPLRESYTPGAVVSLAALVKDDLAIQRVVLYINDRATPLVEVATPPAIDLSEAWPPRGEQHTAESDMDLAQIEGLVVGSTVRIRVVASDFKPQESIAAEATFTIITPEELKSRINQQQASLLERLQETLRLQQTIRSQTRTWQETAEMKRGELTLDREASQGIVLGQRRIRDHLNGDTGALQLADQALSELTSNRVDDPQLINHLKSIRSELSRLADNVVPSIETQLEQAAKLTRLDATAIPSSKTASGNAQGELASALSSATDGQAEVIESLEEMVDRLSQWGNYRSVADDVEQMRLDEDSLLREMQTLSTAARDLSQLSPDESAMLKRIGDRQAELAGRLDRLHQRLERMQEHLRGTDPTAAATIQRGLQVLDERSLGSQMRDTAQHLAKNRVGSAVRNTEQIIEGLEQLKDAFQGSSADSPSASQRDAELQRMQELAQAIAELATLQRGVLDRTEELAKQVGQSGNLSDVQRDAARQLASEQGELVKRTTDVAGKSNRIEVLAEILRGIGGLMDRAVPRLKDGQVDQQTLRPQRLATTRLEQLAKAFQRSESDKPENSSEQSEQPNKPRRESPISAVELRVLRDWQVEVNQATEEFAKSLGDKSELTDDQQRELSELAVEEATLAQLVQKIVDKATASANARPEDSAAGNSEKEEPKRDPAQPKSDSKSDQSGKKPAANLDDKLFDDLTPKSQPERTTVPPRPSAPPPGEDVGQPSQPASRLAEIGRQMSQAEERLRQSDASPATRELQQRISTSLSQLIDELDRPGNQQQSSQQRSVANQPTSKSGEKDSATGEPNRISAPSKLPSSAVGDQRMKWSHEVWGTLPDHVRQRFNNLGDEQFLPEFEEIIRQYYDRLSERGRREH